MRHRANAAPRSRPHVALLVETSLGSGRDILRGIARYGREHEAWSLYYEPRSLEESVPRWLRSWKGNGIIARIQNRAIAREVLAAGIPTVDVLGLVPGTGLPLVHVDDGAIARLAAEHLLERGFRHFGYFGIKGENWSQRRRQSFGSAVKQAGCALQCYELPRLRLRETSWESAEDDLAHWVAALPKPAGVMVCSDQRGPQFLEACRRAGVQVPDEVAVIGVDDDVPLCEVCNPPLSSVRPGHDRVGYQAAALLDALMQGREFPSGPMLLQPQGVTTRLSTEVLAIDDRQVADALRQIREQACAGLQVTELARHVGLSRSVLQRRFRTQLKRTVHQELLQVRVRRAQELLAETDLPLVEIADRAGFKHQEYLGAVFKARTGKTPAQFRRDARS
eukprot:TRINITY_DN11942_c0_g1_i1.p1 TRINITY_DN11942_c0_g1~~TRINITY_DN11942_c0_g1_i1.p1  ORF type:complete len:393 (+),score=29.61 TRINITY_DN11942_c0_g1_i1:358-1536(+)